ncbi:MAG TPA: hypothetical protein VMZ66_11495 [Aeromicrobium sp.]|nr:hypothetical protein [Aeromicrobium sp.]
MLPPRVIILAPREGSSGVGDHATRLIDALRGRVEVVEMRHGVASDDSSLDLWRFRRKVRAAIRAAPPGTVVHAEVSGGSSHAFWAMQGLDVRRTATLHDAPRPFWLPFVSRGVARFRPLRAVMLRVLSPLSLALERRWTRDVDAIALSSAGAQAIRGLGMARTVTESRLLLPDRPLIAPVWDRPPAVGLFGHVYRGKGFDALRRLRSLLPHDVALRVAGQGTELLNDIAGVEISGPVFGADEDAWFASVRVILLPYFRAPIGGIAAVAASAVQAEATAYETPCLALSWPTMDELAAEGGCETVATLEQLAERAAALATSAAEARQAHARLMAFRAAHETESVLAPYLRMWDQP